MKTARTKERKHALAKHLDISVGKISPATWQALTFLADIDGPDTYRVLTDDEANAAVEEYIAETLWAFSAMFIEEQTRIAHLADILKPAQETLCESSNAAILAIVRGTCGLPAFVRAAVAADGRGPFLAHYDSDEHESGEFFIYRLD